ncbi:hypothetical protein K491DRAFT_699474 [Lophiostoma macrostomum CBS 122681]|uniref:F-box domain-containing protein n=1 Tax=Lophiostoma macrostomum CBS 122681 TaxID=1314788 RepID=A0A6A6SJB2_9PLEO|nr:hypothetical protein K491DRAFT_699474 [Lophiostoma macrostomum CBS 122681]
MEALSLNRGCSLLGNSLWVLLSLTKGLKHVTCIGVNQPDEDHDHHALCRWLCFSCIWGLATLPGDSAVGKLQSLAVKYDTLAKGSEGFHFILRHSWLFRLSQSVSLSFGYLATPPEGYFDSVSRKYLLPSQEEKFSSVRELEMRGESSGGLMNALFTRCKSVRTLAYAPNTWFRHSTELLELNLPLISGVLQHLKIEIRCSGPVRWPSNLNTCAKLKSLAIIGQWNSTGDPPLETSLPPNIESLRLQSYWLDSSRTCIALQDYESVYQSIEDFLSNAKTYYPRLRNVVVGGRLPWEFGEEALNKMQGGVVYLISKREWSTVSGLDEKLAREEGKEVFALMK